MKELDEVLRLTSVDGSGVEYVGYVDLELEVDGWICLAGFLVLKGDVKPALVLGSNVFRQWAERGVNKWRRARWRHVAALYDKTEGDIHIAGKLKVLVEGNSKRIVRGTVKAGIGTVCVQGLDTDLTLIVSGAVVVEQDGCVPIELVNLSREDVYIKGGCKIGNWQARVQCVEAVEDASGNLENIRDKIVVGDLSENEEKVFRALLGEFSDVFSQSEHDVGNCDKIPHRINLVDTIM